MQTVLISGVDGTIVNFEHVTRIYKQGGYIHAELTTGKQIPLYFNTNYDAVNSYFDSLVDNILDIRVFRMRTD